MGGSSPSVFHTTPPQPALKARTTLYSLSVGGAEASQNGFGDLMPTKLVLRSAMGNPPLRDPSTPHPSPLPQGKRGIFVAVENDGFHSRCKAADRKIIKCRSQQNPLSP